MGARYAHNTSGPQFGLAANNTLPPEFNKSFNKLLAQTGLNYNTWRVAYDYRSTRQPTNENDTQLLVSCAQLLALNVLYNTHSDNNDVNDMIHKT